MESGRVMKPTRTWRVSLLIAGLLQIGMALAHFYLHYEWQRSDLSGIPAQLAWGLFALNFSWAVLVLGIGALIARAAGLNAAEPFVRLTLWTVTMFWTAHGIYLLIAPMPLPPPLLWLRAPILAFPALVVALHVVALIATRSQRRMTDTLSA